MRRVGLRRAQAIVLTHETGLVEPGARGRRVRLSGV
jgi:hypothetical protein